MNRRIYRACYSILDNFSSTDVDEIVEVLKHYNKCKEGSRAPCLAKGCENDNSELNKRVQPYRESMTVNEQFSARAKSVYSGPSTSSCPRCGRAY